MAGQGALVGASVIDDLCVRCLVCVDARACFTARWADQFETFPATQANPRVLANWHEQVMIKSGGGAVFDLDALRRVLTAVTTWHGDPICAPHLWELVEDERRRR